MPEGLGAWVLLHAVVAAAGTWLARHYALARRLVDQPGERRSHGAATPRGGGVGIVLAMLVAEIALIARAPSHVPALALMMAGLLAVAGAGWVDDHRPLSPWLRLGVHALAGVLLALAVVVSGGGLAQALVAIAAVMVLVNVWNFMDGIDGIACTQAALVAIAYAAMTSDVVVQWLGWALAAACLGFLPFNFPKARIFLGDVGSGGLGYLVAALLVMGFDAAPASAWALLPLSAFLLDAALTLGTRMVRGEQWWTPHVGHLYQRLARSWNGHTWVTVCYAVWTVCAIWLLWLVRAWEPMAIMGAVLAWYLAGSVIWKLVTGRLERGKSVDRDIAR